MTPRTTAAALRRLAGAATTTATLLVIGVSPAGAATYTAHDGASLASALHSANAQGGASVITLAAGTYIPDATLTVRGEVTLTGPPGVAGAVIDGSGVMPTGSELLLVAAKAHAVLVNLAVTTGGQVGGAPAISDAGALDLESSALVGNNGAGLVVEPGGTATARNSTISDGLGAGLVDNGQAKLINVTVAANAVEGIDRLGGSLSLINTIVAGNGAPDCSAPAQVSDHSLDGDGTCGVGALSRTPPKLGALLAANGGPTPTRALAPGSPAIDAGDQAQCPPEDQRHYARADGQCDIGAYEAGARPGSPGGGPAPPGGGIGSRPAGRGPVGVSGHGSLRGSRGARITFVVRARVTAPHGTFSYGDPARRLRLRTLSIATVAIDAARGTASIRGAGIDVARRRRVTFTVVITDHLGRRSVRVRLSSGYVGGGPLLRGAIAFTGASPTTS